MESVYVAQLRNGTDLLLLAQVGLDEGGNVTFDRNGMQATYQLPKFAVDSEREIDLASGELTEAQRQAYAAYWARQEQVSLPTAYAAQPLRQPGPLVPAEGRRVRLTQQTRLRFLRAEIEGLSLDTVLEMRILNLEGTNSDPRPLDLLFRCTVRQFQTFFDLERDLDWRMNGTHSWSRFPGWAEAYVVEGRIGA